MLLFAHQAAVRAPRQHGPSSGPSAAAIRIVSAIRQELTSATSPGTLNARIERGLARGGLQPPSASRVALDEAEPPHFYRTFGDTSGVLVDVWFLSAADSIPNEELLVLCRRRAGRLTAQLVNDNRDARAALGRVQAFLSKTELTLCGMMRQFNNHDALTIQRYRFSFGAWSRVGYALPKDAGMFDAGTSVDGSPRFARFGARVVPDRFEVSFRMPGAGFGRASDVPRIRVTQTWAVSGGRLKIAGSRTMDTPYAALLRLNREVALGRRAEFHQSVSPAVAGALWSALLRHWYVAAPHEDVRDPWRVDTATEMALRNFVSAEWHDIVFQRRNGKWIAAKFK